MVQIRQQRRASAHERGSGRLSGSVAWRAPARCGQQLEAEAAVHLAVLLVQWLTSGALAGRADSAA